MKNNLKSKNKNKNIDNIKLLNVEKSFHTSQIMPGLIIFMHDHLLLINYVLPYYKGNIIAYHLLKKK